MAHNLAEVLEQNVDKTKAGKNLAEYVSHQLAGDYARLSPRVYELEREIVVIPENSKEILERFNLDVTGKQFTVNGPKTRITMPLLTISGYNEKSKQVACQGTTTVDYEINFVENLPQPEVKEENWRRRENNLSFFGVDGNLNVRCQYGKQHLSGSIKGTWTYEGKVESITVKTPALPEKIWDTGAQAQLRYFQILTEAKQQGYFPGQTLSQPELHLLWIPRQEDFEVKVEEMKIVHPDPALILRIDQKHDHVVSLWHTETEEPLEFLVRRHSQ